MCQPDQFPPYPRAIGYAQSPAGDDYVMAEPIPALDSAAAPFWATIHPAGHVTFRPTAPTVADLQTAVGGYFEPMPGTPGFVALACEDGLQYRFAPNPLASAFLRRPVVGVVAIIGPADARGEATPIPDAIRARLVHEVIEA